MCTVIEDLFKFRYPHNYLIEREKILSINIYKKAFNIDDIDELSKYKNIEKITICVDIEEFDMRFIEKFANVITKLNNVCEVNILKFEKFCSSSISLMQDNYYELNDLLFIKNLKNCDINHNGETAEKDEKEKCIYCNTIKMFSATTTQKCIIETLTNKLLLNKMSYAIKHLVISSIDITNLIVDNLSINIEKLTIIYKDSKNANEIYEKYFSKIKLPYECELEIIRDFEFSIRKKDGLKMENRIFRK